MSPPVFVNYRRADEPFAAALAYAVLTARWDGDPVFLDTRFLRQKGDVSRQLVDAVRSSELVLAVIGPRWADPDRRERLADPRDWVRRELEEAARAGVPVVPVLVDRGEVPAGLPLEPVPEWDGAIHLSSADFWATTGPLVDRVAASIGRPTANRTDGVLGAQVRAAVDAMLRHVLPSPQRNMKNDEMIARVVSDQLEPSEWLRFVATANRPRRPNGSCIVSVTSEHLVAADLGSDFRPRSTPARIHLGDVRSIDRTDYRRALVKPVSDLRIAAGDAVLELQGFFAEEADELLDLLAWLTAVRRG